MYILYHNTHAFTLYFPYFFTGWYHNDIKLQLHGELRLTFPPLHYSQSSMKNPIVRRFPLIHQIIPVKPSGRIEYGVHLFPFTFSFIPSSTQSSSLNEKKNVSTSTSLMLKSLLETYHGTFIHVSYMLSISIARGFFSRTLENQLEFILHSANNNHFGLLSPPLVLANSEYSTQQQQSNSHPVLISFNHTNMNTDSQFTSLGQYSTHPQSLSTPQFDIRGQFYSYHVYLNHNYAEKEDDDNCIRGEIKVQYTNIPISSLDVFLNRVETFGVQSSSPSTPHNFQNSHNRDQNSNNTRTYKTTVQSQQIMNEHPLLLPTPTLPIHFALSTTNNVRYCTTIDKTEEVQSLGFWVKIEYEVQIVCKFQGGLNVRSNAYPLLFSRRNCFVENK